ncbi:hypothetical protein RugamoR1_64260 [Rugamonas sp. R1(2021)]
MNSWRTGEMQFSRLEMKRARINDVGVFYVGLAAIGAIALLVLTTCAKNAVFVSVREVNYA